MFKRKKKIKETKKINTMDLLKRGAHLVIGCMLYAIAFNVFFLPENIVYGGLSGVSIVVNKIFGIEPSIFILIVSLLLLIVSYLALGLEKTKGSIAGSIVFPICVELTANLGNFLQMNIDNVLLIAIFGAIVNGLGAGIVFKSGFTTGGTDIINQIISKYGRVSIGKAMLMSDGIIVLFAGFFLGEPGVIFAYEKVMYAIIVLYIISIMADKVILGISQAKSFYVMTSSETEVKKYLLHRLKHGVTVLEGRGGYTGNHQKVIMCIVPTKEYFMVKEGILKIDPNALLLVTDAYEITGAK